MKHIIAFNCAARLFSGVALSFALGTLPACSKKKDAASNDKPPVIEAPAGDAEPEVVPVPEPEPAPLPERFENPGDLATAIAAQLQQGNIANALTLIGPEKARAASAYGLEHLFSAGAFHINPDNPFDSIGELNGRRRYALNLLPDDPSAAPAKVLIDLIPHATKGWTIDSVHVPDTLRGLARAAGIPEPQLDPDELGSGTSAPARGPDSLMKAETFLSSVLGQDYESAVALCDPLKVPEEKIAALCIVFEEGEYRMKEDRPLMTTGLGDDSAWVIAQVESDLLRTKSDFGMEMQRTDGEWKIIGLNFSKMLAEYAAASEVGEVPYTPIVKNPRGGESLVLYFEYDESRVAARTRKQIDIIARILRADTKKTLSISGHADANGTDEYNDTLSANRATAVKEALIAAGVPEVQIVTEAMGESTPLRPNVNPDGTDNPDGRGHNRRAEVFLNF